MRSCESIPNYNALVKRAGRVKVDALDLEGNKVTVNAAGFLARLLQHEMDHLEGLMYVDKMDTKSFRHDKVIAGSPLAFCCQSYIISRSQYIDKYEVHRR